MKALILFYLVVMLLIFTSIEAHYVKAIKENGGLKGNVIKMLKGTAVSIVVSLLWFPILIVVSIKSIFQKEDETQIKDLEL